MYHSECNEAAGDSLHDLLQYCQGKLVWLMAGEEDWKEITTERNSVDGARQELVRRHKKVGTGRDKKVHRTGRDNKVGRRKDKKGQEGRYRKRQEGRWRKGQEGR